MPIPARSAFVLSILLLFHVVGPPLRAATYYVDKDSLGGTSSNSNPGTITQPWFSIDKANSVLKAGDTVYIRKGTYKTSYIRPASSGAAESNRITYTNYKREEVTVTGTDYGILLSGRSYITVTGIRFVDCLRNVYMSNSHHNIVQTCLFDNPGGPTTWAGSRLYDGSQYNRIESCTFSRYGVETFRDGSYQDRGAVLDIGNDLGTDHSDYNLIISNSFSYGGHHILGVYANYNIIRLNTFHNEEWFPCHRSDVGGLCGNRNVILRSSRPGSNIRNLIEDNHIVFSGVPPDQDGAAGMGVRTEYNIVRRNVFYHCDTTGLSLTSISGTNTNGPSNNYVYNNVFYRNGYPLVDEFKPSKSGLLLARWVNDSSYAQITGVKIKNNIFHQNQLQAIYFYNVKAAEQTVENNWEHAGDPGFVDISGNASPADFGVFNFHLRPQSPCIDNGDFLTRTAGSGSNSTVLKVEEAGYFTDGFGMIAGDRIQLAGQTRTARIVEIDYASDTITIDSPLSWAAGTGVSLPYSGARPDQGAYEYVETSSGSPPGVPPNLRQVGTVGTAKSE